MKDSPRYFRSRMHPPKAEKRADFLRSEAAETGEGFRHRTKAEGRCRRTEEEAEEEEGRCRQSFASALR